MATYSVTMNRRNGSGGWDVMYPKTIIAQIQGINTVGENILGLANPSAERFIRINADNTITLRSDTDVASDIGAASTLHNHTANQITHNTVGLDTIISQKADLINGEIDPNQIPDFIFGGLRFDGSFDETDNTSNPTLQWLYSQLVGSNDEQKVGGYFVCTEVGSTGSVTVGTGTGHTWQEPGDEGDWSGDVDIEPGDWLVYIGSNTWAVVNNTYALATKTVSGVVKLSLGLSTTRAALDVDTDDATKVLNEASARKVLRDIFYANSDPGTGLEGDLWFQGSFV